MSGVATFGPGAMMDARKCRIGFSERKNDFTVTGAFLGE
jgi:hypothetical protein